jgi:hypothetical protein
MILPVIGASLFLLLQSQPDRGTIEGVVLNIYKIFAWENIERNSFFDPDVLKQFEQKGKPVTTGESSNGTVDVTVIH